MIVDTMTKAELYKELTDDTDWLCGRLGGLAKKFNKALKNKRVADRAILEVVEYTTPNNNKVISVIQKVVIKDKYATPTITSMFEYTTRNGMKRYIFPALDFDYDRIKYLLIFSAHAVSRMRDRLGMTIKDLLENICTINDTCTSVFKYDYNDNDNEYAVLLADCIGFAVPCDWGFMITTIINQDQEYENQTELADTMGEHIADLSKFLTETNNGRKELFNILKKIA